MTWPLRGGDPKTISCAGVTTIKVADHGRPTGPELNADEINAQLVRLPAKPDERNFWRVHVLAKRAPT